MESSIRAKQGNIGVEEGIQKKAEEAVGIFRWEVRLGEMGDVEGRKKELEGFWNREGGCTNLHEAVHANLMDRAIEVLSWVSENKEKNKNLINEKDRKGRTAAQIAVQKGYEPIIALLLSHRCSQEAIYRSRKQTLCDKYGSAIKTTLLHVAVERNFVGIVQLLVRLSKVNVKECDGRYDTPLHVGIANGCERGIVECLIEAGADVNQKNVKGETALHVAAFMGRRDIVEVLLNATADMEICTNEGRTALHCAIVKGKEAIALDLIKRGAKVNNRDAEGLTPLRMAIRAWSEKVFNALIKKGANVRLQLLGQGNLLHFAVKSKWLFAVQKLVEGSGGGGFDLEEGDENGYTVLQQAVFSGQKDIVEYLVSKGADVMVESADGQNLLHLLVAGGHMGVNKEILKLLIEKGVDKEQYNGLGTTPLLEVCSRGDWDVEALLELGVDVNRGEECEKGWGSGDRPLHVVFKLGHAKKVELLLNYGANVGLKNKEGRSVLEMALRVLNDSSAEMMELFVAGVIREHVAKMVVEAKTKKRLSKGWVVRELGMEVGSGEWTRLLATLREGKHEEAAGVLELEGVRELMEA